MACVKKTCKPTVDPGSLDTLVERQALLLVDDGAGGQVKTWVPDGTFWAKVEQTSGREVFADEQLRQEGDHKLTCRWGDIIDLFTRDRLVIDGTIFNIRSIQDEMYAHTVGIILAERGVPT